MAKDHEIDLGDMDAIFGVHLGLANSFMIQDFKRELEDLQLTPKQTALLWLADENAGIAQVDVARVLRVDRATMLAITNKMVKRGFIARGAARQNKGPGGRRIGLHLTAVGRKALAEARTRIARHEQRMKAKLAPGEVEAVTKVLKKLYG
ncbi:MAG: MarR family winged helix-turn-helix transcriptional regulator [Allosphingosinicella sp.]